MEGQKVFDHKIVTNNITTMIMNKCEDHNIRLTPSEYRQLIEDYKNKFINNIDTCSLIQLAENIIRKAK